MAKYSCRHRFENGGNHCGVLKKRLTLAPDEDARLIFMLGEGGRETGRAMREKYTAARAWTTISAALRNSGTISSAAFRYQRPMRA